MNDITIQTTDDGSHTLYSKRFDQQYHNAGGAIAESNHVFFETNGLNKAIGKSKPINILEIGFGTGLNLLLLLDQYLDNTAAQINYHTIEAYPITPERVASLNYGRFLNHNALIEKLPPIFDSLRDGTNTSEIISGVQLNVFCGLFKNYRPNDIQFDYIFHDAFSPYKNSELWTDTVFSKLHGWSKSNALLTTYCAASKVRGAMAYSGWKVARAPGALRKREMTIASPTASPLQSFKRINEERFSSRFENDDFS